MWVSRFLTLVLFVACVTACGGKSVRTFGGEAGAGSECEGGDVQCDGTCVDLVTDEFNCGDCGNRCARSERCTGGRCISTSDCEPGTARCGAECVDLSTSQNNCGSCGVACPRGYVCSNGACTSPCPGSQCGSVCVDFGSDPNNCGGCGNTCSSGTICSAGTCINPCSSGAFCNGACIDISSDRYNCGACNFACTGADVGCVGGLCQIVCSPEALNCNGACVDWRFDRANCGGCGIQCVDSAECENGMCVETCRTGTYCRGVCVDTSNDPMNCGGCDIPCMSGRCVGGMCVSASCGDGIRQPNEEGDPPPGSLMAVPLDPVTCRYDFSRINQWYCHGGCGNWGGADDCDIEDAHTFCKLKMDNPRSQAVSFEIGQAYAAPGVCCPPPTYAPGALGCTSLGVLSSRGVNINVSVHPTSLVSSHQAGRIVTNLVCTDP